MFRLRVPCHISHCNLRCVATTVEMSPRDPESECIDSLRLLVLLLLSLLALLTLLAALLTLLAALLLRLA